MKARLVPLYFDPGRDADFDRQVKALRELLGAEAELLPPVPLGSPLPEADAVVFPQLLGTVYGQVERLRHIPLPILIITSEFGTVSMWDWEIASFLRSRGIDTFAPFNVDQARTLCRALALRRRLAESRILVYQDNPGEGFQASIFKRFFWWEDECSSRMRERFGLTVVRRSLRELGERAKAVSDQEADEAWRRRPLPVEGTSIPSVRSAVKLYLALKQDLGRAGDVVACGTNCLNESHFCDTTPCLAWSMLYEEQGLTWGCEADTVSMLTQYLLHESLRVPVMMSNLYPFVLGQAALKHENIPAFPEAADPQNCILVAHCGYFGLLPPSFATEWALRPKVLAIVDDNATAVDARLPLGDVTLAKLGPTLDRFIVVEGRLESYVQYSDSDCLNGGVIRVPDGPRLVNALPSHHYLIVTGHHRTAIEMLARVLGLGIEVIG